MLTVCPVLQAKDLFASITVEWEEIYEPAVFDCAMFSQIREFWSSHINLDLRFSIYRVRRLFPTNSP
jgi:hypothetical protein